MGVLENMLETFSKMQSEIQQLNSKIDELQIRQEEEQILRRKDLQEFLGFGYAATKELTSRSDFPSIFIGGRECYIKSQVIEYLKKDALKENKQPPKVHRTNTVPDLYTIR